MPGDIQTVERPVTRLQQATDFYCGAACSAMVFNYFGMWVEQDQAYRAIRSAALEPNAWYSDPQGMAGCLNSPEFTPDQIEFSVGEFIGENYDALFQRLYHTLAIVGMPCPVLVRGGAHWMIVDGIRCAPRDDGGQDLLGLFFTDPFRTEPARKLVPIEVATEQYLTPIRFGTHWKGKLAMMSDASAAFVAVTARVPMGGGGAVNEIDVALTGLEFLGYAGVQSPAGKFVLESLATVVRSIDTGAPIYSLIAVDGSANAELNRLVYAAVEPGRLLEVCLNSSNLTFLGDDAARELLRRRFPNAQVIDIEHGYFWKECIELRSRFAIVRRAIVDGAIVYVLPGGEVLLALTTGVKGGA